MRRWPTKRCSIAAPASVAVRVESTTASTKRTLRALARRWLELAGEITEHDRVLDQLTGVASPSLRGAFGIGADTAAEMLIVFGDNPERIHSEAIFAKLCGVAPIPASSGKTNRHRLSRGGHRQANSALYRVVIVRGASTSQRSTTSPAEAAKAARNGASSAA